MDEVTNLVVILKKNKIKNFSMPKFSILLPISDEILPLLCSNDNIQSHFELAWFLMLRTKPFLEGFVWTIRVHNRGYYTVMQTYEVYLRVEIFFSMRNKLHKFKPTCNFLFITQI